MTGPMKLMQQVFVHRVIGIIMKTNHFNFYLMIFLWSRHQSSQHYVLSLVHYSGVMWASWVPKSRQLSALFLRLKKKTSNPSVTQRVGNTVPIPMARRLHVANNNQQGMGWLSPPPECQVNRRNWDHGMFCLCCKQIDRVRRNCCYPGEQVLTKHAGH